MEKLILNKKIRRTIIGILLLSGLVISGYSLLAGNSNEMTSNVDNEEKRAVSVETMKIRRRSIGRSINLSGITKALDELMLSPKMSGRLAAFYVQEGGHVNAGQLIARLEEDPTLLASYNNAQAGLVNTISVANQNINNAKLGVASAETNLANTKNNAKENIRNAELAVDLAKGGLKSAEKSLGNTENSSKQSIQNAYDNIKTTMQNNLVVMKTALIAVGDIIGEEPGLPDVNKNYEDVLSVKDNRQSLSKLKLLFSQAKKSYENTEKDYFKLDSFSTFTEIDATAEEAGVSLRLMKDTLNEALIMLDNTITKSDFPFASLSALKTSISGKLTAVNGAISMLEANKQAISGAKLADTSSGDNLKSAYDSAKKNLEIAEQRLILTETQAKTQIDAAEKGLESARANLESAKKGASLQISSAQAQVNSIKAQLENTAITAPISGILNQIFIKSGEMAAAGKPIASIINTESIKIELAVTEFDIGRIRDGQSANILLSAYPEKKFLGKIYYVGASADEVSKKFPVKIQINNEDKKIKAGMVARVEILPEERKEALVIPKTAVFTEDGIEKVYVVDKNKQIKIKRVKTEAVDGKELIIKEGLNEGEEMVINGSYDLKEGDKVNIAAQ